MVHISMAYPSPIDGWQYSTHIGCSCKNNGTCNRSNNRKVCSYRHYFTIIVIVIITIIIIITITTTSITIIIILIIIATISIIMVSVIIALVIIVVVAVVINYNFLHPRSNPYLMSETW
uniref:Uncharacterized protein n=1 Tax=Octopus bimaculoides TaxID=37653 RepID=A0A0L8H205_OCTBM